MRQSKDPAEGLVSEEEDKKEKEREERRRERERGKEGERIRVETGGAEGLERTRSPFTLLPRLSREESNLSTRRCGIAHTSFSHRRTNACIYIHVRLCGPRRT